MHYKEFEMVIGECGPERRARVRNEGKKMKRKAAGRIWNAFKVSAVLMLAAFAGGMLTASVVFWARLGWRLVARMFCVVLLAGLVCGCKRTSGPTNVICRTVIIEGCEYLEFPGYRWDALTHKGNCTNECHNHHGR